MRHILEDFSGRGRAKDGILISIQCYKYFGASILPKFTSIRPRASLLCYSDACRVRSWLYQRKYPTSLGSKWKNSLSNLFYLDFDDFLASCRHCRICSMWILATFWPHVVIVEFVLCGFRDFLASCRHCRIRSIRILAILAKNGQIRTNSDAAKNGPLEIWLFHDIGTPE